LSKPAAEAMRHLTDDALGFGSLHYDQWLAAYEGLRMAAAQLIGSSPREIAIVKNTSEGVAMVATGMDWKSGDRIVAFHEEFPANFLPWKKLEESGVEITWLSVEEAVEDRDDACRGARRLDI